MILEDPVTISVPGGVTLEAMLGRPPAATSGVVVCHPHPLYGGDMESPVVTTVVEIAAAREMATLRFNFRGVAQSTGQHDGGAAEVLDARAALACLESHLGASAGTILAGYSFGSIVAMRVAASQSLAGLVLVAPPLGRGERGPLPPIDKEVPVLVIAGRHDDYCPVDRLDQIRQAWPHATVRIVDGADHFFSGRFRELGAALHDWLGAAARTPRA
jgi:hypothetical protein